MDDTEATEEEDSRPPDGPRGDCPYPPPLRLAGIDEDDLWEPHVVRGID
ncbi:hypothetical protein A6P39_044755 (plasmid) [Streptomyces sp. FXJ1.172]|nr:hypothetical protein [Streptomyces sp. FXJ1.172]WEP00968.1 hypothetical protein A6P39_044755 [Streptomyces sp. FXJ1.172]